MPAICALAGLVPCADSGIRQTLRCAFAARLVPGLDDQQPGVFALRAGVGLQADAGVAGGLRQPGAQLAVELGVAGELLGRRERMDVRELGPGDRDHLARRVQLHRARAERDHRAVEREVLVGQAAHVAQHLGLAVVRVEDRVRQVRRCVRSSAGGTAQRDAVFEAVEARARGLPPREHAPQRVDVVARGRLVERDAERSSRSRGAGSCRPPPRRRAARRSARRSRPRACRRRSRARACSRALAAPRPAPRCSSATRCAMRFRPAGPVVDRVHARHHGRQHLRGADVRRRLLAPDVLLARLQRQPVGRRAVRVDADADQPARQRALELVARRQVGRVRAAVAHRHAEALRGADARCRRPSRRAARAASARAGRRRRSRGAPRACTRVDDRLQVAHRAADARVLQQRREAVAAEPASSAGPTTTLMPSGRARVRTHLERLRQHVVGDEEARRSCCLPHAQRRASSPRPPRWPRRASTRWRSPCR